ncbi:MAG: hypothetical protein QXF12_04705 [Candidatus Aenigmatarchaeota archaeon]
MNKIALTMETLNRYMGSEMPFISSVSFSDTSGERCEYTFKGGFEIKGLNDYVFYDLENCLFPALEETVDESLVEHYTKLCNELLIVLYEGIDARDYDTVTFAFIYNKEKSLSTPKVTLTSYDFDKGDFVPEGEKDLFYMNPYTYNFYDFVIKVKKGDQEEIYDEFKGIPHFIIPAFMKTIGVWLGFAE